MKNYRTEDFYLVCTLTTLGFQIQYLDRLNPRRVCFCLEKTKKLEDAIDSYWKGDLRVEPRAFSANIKFVKNRLYNSTNQ
jgi:hypothetical protein